MEKERGREKVVTGRSVPFPFYLALMVVVLVSVAVKNGTTMAYGLGMVL